MPEGDTVYQTARRLAALTGHTLTASDFRVPSLATSDLSGRVVLGTEPRGKHLLTRVEGGLTLHTHLRMEGRWDVQAAGGRWHRPAHQARVVLRTADLEAIGFSVLLDLVPSDEEADIIGHLGPDLLGPDWDADEAVRRIEAAPDVPLGQALLDQRNLAGLGNVYRAEVLFLSGLSPFVRAGDVRDLPAVVRLSHRVIVPNRDRSRRVTTGVDRPGQNLWVYGRAGRPCRRCGTKVRSAELGPESQERIAYWCPACQP